MSTLDALKARYVIQLLDDDRAFLDALEFSLEAEGWQTKKWTDAAAFLDSPDDFAESCLILDVKMPQLSGPEVQIYLKEHGIDYPIIFLSGNANMDIAIDAFRRGAADFFKKPVEPGALFTALERIVLSEDRKRRSLMAASPMGRFATLTDSEKHVLQCVGQMLSNQSIAERSGRSARTIERHRANAMRKMGFRRPQEVRDFLQKLKDANA